MWYWAYAIERNSLWLQHNVFRCFGSLTPIFAYWPLLASALRNREPMHPFFADVSNLLTSMGRTNPALLLLVSVMTPAAATFTLVMTFKKLTAACWRGYWDVV
jgi:hypothetical protein